MSKKQYIKRHHLIINKLRNKSSSFDEVLNYLQLHSKLDEEDYVIDLRTFQRDIKEIASIYNIEINFNRSKKEYEITENAIDNKTKRLMETFELFNAINLSSSLSNFIDLEKRKSLGTENIFGLLHAIKNHFEISFLHKKYWDEIVLNRKVQPLALKEFKFRWYLVAKDLMDNKIKTFGLDRILTIEIHNNKFEPPLNFNLETHFQNSYGVITDENPPQKIVLSFTYEQGKYIKSLILHQSQKALIDNKKEYRIELFLNPTYDFIMEIMSMGSEVKIIEPESLKDQIEKRLVATLDLYKKR